MEFGTQLIALRKREGISINRLSKLSGVAKSTIYNYEKGVEPTVEKADKILRALGATLILGLTMNEDDAR